jgi:TRAP-type C4-dicarboxylate transport system substrate-binding protein
MPSPPLRVGIVSKQKWKDNGRARQNGKSGAEKKSRGCEFAHASRQTFMIEGRRGGFTMLASRKLAAAALAAALGLSCNEPSHAQTTLTYSSWVPPTHHLTVWQANWAAEVEKATGGRVKFQSLPKAPSAAPGTFDAVRDGLVDLSYVTASYTPARHILPLMAELPGMADTAEVNSVAYSRIHWKHFQKVGEYKGVKLLAVWTHGPGQMFTKKPVSGINDVKSLKIRTGGGIAEAVANAIGASAFVKPAPESYELLNSGVADGVFFPFESIVSFKLETVIGQATVFPGGMYSSSFGFFMNEDKWNKLSKQDQAIIEKYSYEYAARSNGKSWDNADQKGLDALKKASVKIVRADPAFVAEVHKRSAPIIEDWIKKAGAKGVNAKAALDEFRAEIKKVSAEK